MATTTDVCVIGTGFGGGVAALRMAEAGQSVTILEMGHFWDSVENSMWSGKAGAKQFQQTNGDFTYWMDFFNIAGGVNLLTNGVYAVVSGRGVGGGSLVYSGVSLRAPTTIFEDAPWPSTVTRSALDPYYTKAEDQLNVKQLTWDDVAMKDGAMGWACTQAGVHYQPHPNTIDPSVCTGLGWCNNGCFVGAKQSTDRMYIAPALAKGADILTGAMAVDVKPASGGKWQVDYIATSDPSSPNFLWSGTTTSIIASEVFICAGAVNSATILLRSAGNLPGGVSSHTGQHLATHGDFVVMGILPEDLPSSLDGLDMTTGIVDGCTVPDYLFEPPPGRDESNWQPFAMQSVRMLPMSAALTLDPAGMTNSTGNMATFGLGAKHWMKNYGTRLLSVGIIGKDGGDGTVSLLAGVPTVTFTVSQATQNLHDSGVAAMQHIMGAVGGTVLTTWNQYRPNDEFTIHPSSSCRMADSVADGVVDPTGAVYNPKGGVYDGLHVLDCSVLSTPIAVNTSLTTAAVAESALAQILAS